MITLSVEPYPTGTININSTIFKQNQRETFKNNFETSYNQISAERVSESAESIADKHYLPFLRKK